MKKTSYFRMYISSILLPYGLISPLSMEGSKEVTPKAGSANTMNRHGQEF